MRSAALSSYGKGSCVFVCLHKIIQSFFSHRFSLAKKRAKGEFEGLKGHNIVVA